MRGKGERCMNHEIKMSVSALSRKGEEKSVYVVFSDGEASAEFRLPECELVHNKCFSEEEIGQLKEYISAEWDSIYRIAGKVNPLKGFLGKEQGK